MSTESGPTPEQLREAVAGIVPAGPRQVNLLLAFDRLLASWPDRSAHQAFVYEGTQAGELALVGRLYRAVLERWPEDPACLAAQKQIATSAMFAGGVGVRGEGRRAVRLPRWIFLSGGVSLVWLIYDVSSGGSFSWLDVGMVLVCLGSLGYAAWALRR